MLLSEGMVSLMPPDQLKLLKGRLGNRGYEAITIPLGMAEDELRSWIAEVGVDRVTYECWCMIAANESLNNFKFTTADGEEIDKTKITEHAQKMLTHWKQATASAGAEQPSTFRPQYGGIAGY